MSILNFCLKRSAFLLPLVFSSIACSQQADVQTETAANQAAPVENASAATDTEADATAAAGKLDIGSPAPSLDVAHWVSQGEFQPVTNFVSGRVYLVEFWATWCSPCIEAMPHISELQDKYKSQNVQVVSISSEDLETVEAFLQRKVRDNPDKTYGELTANYCLTTDPDSSTDADYLNAAGIRGIPCVFVVGKTGLIEWIGHPLEVDEPLQQILSGDWDLEVAKVERAAEAVLRAEAMKMQLKLRSVLATVGRGEVESGLQQLDQIYQEAHEDHKFTVGTIKYGVMMQNGVAGADEFYQQFSEGLTGVDERAALAWMPVELNMAGVDISDATLKQAQVLIGKAIAERPEVASLDTQAHLYQLQGKLSEAIRVQTRAVAEAPESYKAELEAYLEVLMAEKAAQK